MAEADATGQERPKRRSRRWLVVVGVVLAIGAALAFVFARAPDYVARYLARTYFQGLNIDTSGVETININLFRGEISFGPVSFKGTGGEPGQLGRIGIRIDVRRLFQKQALIDSAVIEGIRIDIRQAATGEISINGIPLTQILAEQAAKSEAEAAKSSPLPPQPPSPSPPDVPPTLDQRLGWGAGLDRLELRDSRVVFTRERGGQATIEVAELDLEGFATWAPADPGRFRLDGDLNQIHIAVAGTATPFAQSVDIDAKVEVTGIELGKVERFAGPLGFNPNAGRIDVAVNGRGSVDVVSGRIEAELQGNAKLSDVDMANPAFGTLRLAQGTANLNGIRVLADASGNVDVSGDASLDLGTMGLRLDDGTEVGIGSAKIALPALKAALSRRAVPAITITPELDVEALTLGGPSVKGKIATAAIRLSRFDMDTTAAGTPFTLTGVTDIGGLDLTIPDVEPIRITADAVKATLDGARFAFPPGSTSIDGGFGVDATNLLVTIFDQATGGAPPSAIRIGAAAFAGTLPTLVVDDGNAGTKVKIVAPALALDRFRLEAPLEPGSDLRLSGAEVKLKSVDVDVVDAETLLVSGRVGLSAPSLSLRVGAPDRAQVINGSLSRLGIDLKQFSYREAGAVSGFGFKGRIDSDAVRARIGGEGSEPGKAIDLAGLRLAVDDLVYEAGGPTPKQRLRASLGLKSAEATMPGGEMPIMLSIDRVMLDGAEADLRPPGRYGFDRLAVGKFDLSLTRRAPSTEETAASAAAKAEAAAGSGKTKAQRPWPPENLPVIRVGQMGLLAGGKISMLDQSLSPPASATINIETLSLQNVDSTNPASRADLRLKARLADAQITADGWALPFKPRPDFDLRMQLNEILLPQVNPYVAPQIGLDITEGKLVAGAEGRATAGQLQGEVRATVGDLRFADRPDTGSNRITKSVGVPLSTIIGLLEDPDGTIDITLPFEGDLLSPEFDYSDMIWSTVFRVLRALVTSPFKLISASVAVLSATDGGSGNGGTAAAEAGAAPGLAPLAFAPGEAAIAGETQRAVVGLRQVLKDRPRLNLSVCGVATGKDVDLLIGNVDERERAAATTKALPKLRELAQLRTRAVRDALTDGTGIERARVPFCAEPRADPADHGPPRVDLAF
ncbi:MAG: DUF748 domain-containing protein [Rhodospirillales bacterium]